MAPLPTLPYVIVHTPQGRRQILLTGGTVWSIGRSGDNAIVLADTSVSRKHALLQRMDNGTFYLVDLGSRNGSRVPRVKEGRLTIPVALQPGDQITLGKTQLEFYAPAPESQADEHVEEDSSTVALSAADRRLITVMVMDIRDFTKLTHQLEEQLLSEVMGRWFQQAGDIIRQYGSRVDKYIGDAVMAVWFHSPQQRSDQIPVPEMQQVLEALQQLYAMSEELNRDFPLPFPLRVGAGVNTGYAMVAHMGERDRAEYTPLGDTVNAAFRLESATKELKVDLILGAATFQYLPRSELSPFLPHTLWLKGYEEPVEGYAGKVEDLTAFLATLKAD